MIEVKTKEGSVTELKALIKTISDLDLQIHDLLREKERSKIKALEIACNKGAYEFLNLNIPAIRRFKDR